MSGGPASPEPLFSPREVEYIATQRLARMATVAVDGQPDVAPVGFRFDGTDFFVGGRALRRTLKYKNVKTAPLVALALDDFTTGERLSPRGLKIHGHGEVVERPEGGEWIRITPKRSWSWGIEEPTFQGDDYVIPSRP